MFKNIVFKMTKPLFQKELEKVIDIRKCEGNFCQGHKEVSVELLDMIIKNSLERLKKESFSIYIQGKKRNGEYTDLKYGEQCIKWSDIINEFGELK